MKYAWFLSMLFSVSVSFSQKLNFRVFSFEQGLSTYNIQKIIQDKNSFLWIGTQNGLYRYNGNNFEVFKKYVPEYAPLREKFIYDIAECPSGDLCIAEYNAGIDILNPTTLKVSNVIGIKTDTADGLPGDWIKKVFCDKKNNIWVGGRNFLSTYSLDKKKFTHITRIPGLNKDININFIGHLNDSLICVVIANYGLVIFDTEQRMIAAIQKFFPDYINRKATITATTIIKDTIYLATEDGLIIGQIKDQAWNFIRQLQFPDQKNFVVNCITTDTISHKIWLGTNAGLASVNLNSGSFELLQGNVQKKRWLQDNSINDVFIDNQHNLWIGCSKVLHELNLDPSPFTWYSGDDTGSDKMDHIYTLAAKSKDEIFATATDGLYLTNLKSGITKKIPESGSLGTIHFLIQVDQDLWLVSTDKGMFAYEAMSNQLSKKLVQTKYGEWMSYENYYFNNAVLIGKDYYWASAEEGLLKWSIASHAIKKFKYGSACTGGLPENHLHNIKKDSRGNLWLLSDNTISKFDPVQHTVTQIFRYDQNNSELNSAIFFDAFDDKKTMWFATFGGGLNGYNYEKKAWSYITEKDGLCNNTVYGILPEKDSFLWVSTDIGISRLNCYTRAITNFYYEDGLQDNSFDEKGALVNNNKLYFGGLNGFTEVDPARYLLKRTPPPGYIYRVEYIFKGQKKVLNNLQWQSLTFPPQTTSVFVYLCSPSFSGSRKTSFTYRLNNSDQNYIETSGNNTIILNISNYGTYNLDIRCHTSGGESLPQKLSLSFYVQPYWYQTWWFNLLIALSIVSLLYGFYRYRLMQIHKQHQIRKEIAEDLHDDIGATLNSVKIFTHLAETSEEKKKYFTNIKESLAHASVGLRDMIWVLDDAGDTVDDLLKRLGMFAHPVAEASGINISFNADDVIRNIVLNKTEKRNLLLIAKEAINNSIKYAESKNITVTFSKLHNKNMLTLEDDGKGFVQDKITPGNGLNNMQQRAHQVHYNITLESVEGKGTKITAVKR